ncbi:MAG: hypothetical protein R3C53_09945 [Pirellulaceae bacterium]
MKYLLLLLLSVAFLPIQDEPRGKSATRFSVAETADSHFVDGDFLNEAISESYFEETLNLEGVRVLKGFRINESFALAIVSTPEVSPRLTAEQSKLALALFRNETLKARIAEYAAVQREIEQK